MFVKIRMISSVTFRLATTVSCSLTGFAAYLWRSGCDCENLPIALAFIFISTVILIFIQVRSVIIPIKATSWTFYRFQQLCMSSCSMGYGEVCLISRPNQLKRQIQSSSSVSSSDYRWTMRFSCSLNPWRMGSYWWQHAPVANGLRRQDASSWAAAIMVVVFMAFGLSSVVILKQIGLGLALAIFLDAAIVRALSYRRPCLMGKWNWWSRVDGLVVRNKSWDWEQRI